MTEMLLFDVVFHHRHRAERQVVRVVAPGPETVGEGIARRVAPEAVTEPESWFYYGCACRGPANDYDEVDGTAD